MTEATRRTPGRGPGGATSSTACRSSETPAPTVEVPDVPPPPRRHYARWRALSLSLVYVIFAIHIIHWKITGQTLAPLELNEVMYTLELGIITAGFLFMCFLALGTLIFGRFFCSWACHIMVLQDLCAWILRRFRIRDKPIRSRLLLLVPPLTALYMFVWPQMLRAWESRALPTFHFATDSQGWASFVTNNFWRNLPSAPVIILTFLVCGFAIVYLLGTRTFCAYVCPYGAIFGLADRFSPGRIRVSDKCQQCGSCTAACTCGVRVHEEVKQHGMIVNPACLKDLDCVATCPQGALSYRFSKPSLFRSFKSGGRFGSLPYDFSIGEELLIGLVFVVVLLAFRGLYSRIPFLLSLGLGGILGYFAVTTVRLFTRPDVRLATLRLRHCARLTVAGHVYTVFTALLAALVVHSAFVRYHEYSGLRQARALAGVARSAEADALAAGALGHLSTADRWGLMHNPRIERHSAELASRLERHDLAERYALRFLERHPDNVELSLLLAQSLMQQDRVPDAERRLRDVVAHWDDETEAVPTALARVHQVLGGLAARRGDFAEAATELRASLSIDRNRSEVHAELGSVLAELGLFGEAVTRLQEAVTLDPKLAGAHYNLGTILGHLGRFDEAIRWYQRGLENAPDDAALHNNLGYALLQTGELDRSRQHIERALQIDPMNADAHFNLASWFAAREDTDKATEHYRIAAQLDPRYARRLDADGTE